MVTETVAMMTDIRTLKWVSDTGSPAGVGVLRENGAQRIHLFISHHLDSLPEGKTHSRIDQKILETEEYTHERAFLVAKGFSIGQIFVVKPNKTFPDAKSVDRPGG